MKKARILLFGLMVALVAGVHATPIVTTHGLHKYALREKIVYYNDDQDTLDVAVGQAADATVELADAAGTMEDLTARLFVALEQNGDIKPGAAAAFVKMWLAEGAVTARAASNKFLVDGDMTETYVPGRKLMLKTDGTYVYSEVQTAVYPDPIVPTATGVTLPLASIGTTLDEVNFSILIDSRGIPAFLYGLEASDATIYDDLTVGGDVSIVGMLTASGGLTLPAGAASNYVWTCSNGAGLGEWRPIGGSGLDTGVIWSNHIALADGLLGGGTGQSTAGSAKGIKSDHIQPYAVTESKLDPTMLTGSGGAHALIPRGGIIMWSGTALTVPTGWHLCDGSYYPGGPWDSGDGRIPDLRDKFVLSAGTTYPATRTGGAASYVHVHGAGTYASGAHVHGPGTLCADFAMNPQTGYTEWWYRSKAMSPNWTSNRGQRIMYGTTLTGASMSTGAEIAGATDSGGAAAITGSSSSVTVPTLPPYYALCYIIKL